MAVAINILKQPYQVCFSGNPVYYSFAFTPYGYVERNLNLQMKVGIEKEVSIDTDLWVEIKSDLFFPDNTGTVQFDISSIVDAYLKFFTPRFKQISPILVDGQSARFRITALVQQDGQQVGDVITSDPVTVLKGGMSYQEFQGREFFTEYIIGQKKPLHYFGAKKRMTLKEKKFLTWLYPFDDGLQQQVIVKFHRQNGVEDIQNLSLPVDTHQWGIYLISCSIDDIFANFPFLGLVNAALYAFEIPYFTIKVVNSDNVVIVDEVVFELDYFNRDGSKDIAYTNSVGGFDTFLFRGEIDYQADYAATGAQQVVPPTGIKNALLVPQQLMVSNSETEKSVANSDFVSIPELMALRDIFLTRNCYEITDTKFIPIVINKKSVKFYTNRDNLYSTVVEWQKAFTNNYFTPAELLANSFPTCPALDKFLVIQIARNKLQILWAMPDPYDKLQVTIDNGLDIQTVYLDGNSGSQDISFDNPAISPATVDITVKGAVLCNPDSVPVDKGPDSTVVVTAYANLVPIANDDQFAIPAGFNTPQLLSGSVLLNDYDIDGDIIEVDPVTAGATGQGGSYDIDTGGIITYTPPSSFFNGVDTLSYTVWEVADHTSSAVGNVKINVGNVGLGNALYVKIVVRNYHQWSSGGTLYGAGDYSFCFFADPACTIPKNTTGMAIIITNRNRYQKLKDGVVIIDTYVDQNYPAVGTEVFLYSGVTFIRYATHTLIPPAVHLIQEQRTFTLQPGAGYIPI